jgi:hypothetical protein
MSGPLADELLLEQERRRAKVRAMLGGLPAADPYLIRRVFFGADPESLARVSEGMGGDWGRRCGR